MRGFLALMIIGFAYFSIVILPYLIFGFAFIPGIISYPDLIDLLVYPPVIGLLLYYIWRELNIESKILDYIFILLLIVHFVGHGFHWAANAIDVTIENVNGVPGSVYNYAYFLDEILSHKIMYLSIIFATLLILYTSSGMSFDLDLSKKVMAEVSALIFGFSITISFIEGQSPYEAIIFGIALISLSLSVCGKLKEVYRRPFMRYFFHLGLWILFWASLYYIMFHGFPQPSEWM